MTQRIVALQPHDAKGFLQPTTQIVVDFRSRSDTHLVHLPPWAVVDVALDSIASDLPSKGKCGNEVILARHDSGESNPCYENEPRLLGNYLDVSQRLHNRYKFSCESEHSWIGGSKEGLDRKVPA